MGLEPPAQSLGTVLEMVPPPSRLPSPCSKPSRLAEARVKDPLACISGDLPSCGLGRQTLLFLRCRLNAPSCAAQEPGDEALPRQRARSLGHRHLLPRLVLLALGQRRLENSHRPPGNPVYFPEAA